jgi:prepilin-type N-terminal cleavage/methylation domain-containing protein
MRGRDVDEGFSLVEVIIAMFILGLIAVALLPPLWQGIQHSSLQSSVATATRHLNGLVEEARESPNCGRATTGSPSVPLVPNPAAFLPANAAAAGVAFSDGKGETYTVGVFGVATDDSDVTYVCTVGNLVTMRLKAFNSSNEVVAAVTAQIFMGQS